MSDPFADLGLPVALDLEPALVENAWRERCRDSGTEPEAVNSARTRLSDPVSRLEAWLSIVDPEGATDRGISPELMDLFARIGPALSSTDDLLARHRKASTALARALLARESVASQLAVQGLMQEIQPLKTMLIERFPEFETDSSNLDFSGARQALGQLKFLKRWEEQCRDRLLALLAT